MQVIWFAPVRVTALAVPPTVPKTPSDCDTVRVCVGASISLWGRENRYTFVCREG